MKKDTIIKLKLLEKIAVSNNFLNIFNRTFDTSLTGKDFENFLKSYNSDYSFFNNQNWYADDYWGNDDPEVIEQLLTNENNSFIVSFNINDFIFAITNINQCPFNKKIKESIFFKGNGKVPDFWLWKLYANKQTQNDNKDIVNLKIDSFNIFIIYECFKGLYLIDDKSKNDLEQLYNYINQNKSKLDRIMLQAETFRPKMLGAGADGVAFEIAKDKVLKIFTNKFAYEKSLEAINNLYQNPQISKTEAMLYDVGEFPPFKGKKLYYYIIEKFETSRVIDIDDDVYDITTMLKSNKYKELKEMFENKQYDLLNQLIKDVAKEIANKIQIRGLDSFKLNNDWKETFVEEVIMKYISGRTDLHSQNVGVTNNGYLRFFDPAYR